MANTLKLRADAAADIEQAAAILRGGGTVAFPTETVYGLGANAFDEMAVARIFTAKQRPCWDPLIVHIADVAKLEPLVEVNLETERRMHLLAAAFWPGPLTLLLPKRRLVPDVVTSGRLLVGIRVPAHATAQALLRATACPIAAPSANTFGHISPTTAGHVLADLDTRIDAVLDGGPTTVGVESTVIDPTQTPIMLYRPGAITLQQIRDVTGVEVMTFAGRADQQTWRPEALPSPGVGIRHYAPSAPLILVKGDEAALHLNLAAEGVNTGVLLPLGWSAPEHLIIQKWGSWNDPAQLAANLFAGLRALESRGATLIYCPLPPSGGLNNATRDRLMKAARTA